MDNNPRPHLETFFAPAGRASLTDLASQLDACLNSPVARFALESLDGYVAVLNENRQILAANRLLLEALDHEDRMGLPGKRWGETAGCVHAKEGPDGCGTSEACSCCGAVLSILSAQGEGDRPEFECRMAMRRDGKWMGREFLVASRPIDLECGRLVVAVFHDISDIKRRENLESSFLHDISNTILALNGWSALLSSRIEVGTAAAKVMDMAHRLTESVREQKLRIAAESGDVAVREVELDAVSLLESVADALQAHPSRTGQEVVVTRSGHAVGAIRSDPVLLFRILLNMGINALEATSPSDRIELRFATAPDHPSFSVWNPGCMEEKTRLQVFHRSFTTKGQPGRGVGTHTMKILGENLLHGKVWFTSTAEDGTEFFLRLP